MRLLAAAATALLVLAAGCSHPTAPESAPSANAPPAPPPVAGPTPSPGASSVALATASPYRYVVTPPPPAPGMPVISEIDLLDSTIHEGAPYSVRVRTSVDVTAIRVSAMGQTYGMQAAGPGLFASDGQVPQGIPFFFLNRSYALAVTAQTADGRSTTANLSLRLER